MNPGTPRGLTMIEHAVIDKLLSVDFPGSEQLRAQLLHTAVVGVCDCSCATVSLRVDTSATVAAPVISSAPVSADISVGDQYAGVVLLVDNGYLSYLEFYSIGEPVRALPPLEEIHPRPAR